MAAFSANWRGSINSLFITRRIGRHTLHEAPRLGGTIGARRYGGVVCRGHIERRLARFAVQIELFIRGGR